MSELDSELDELRLSLREIYPEHSEQEINSVWSQLLQILDPFRDNEDNDELEIESIWDSSSVVLITYPDSIYRKDESTLKTLAEFVKNRLSGLSSVIHVLLKKDHLIYFLRIQLMFFKLIHLSYKWHQGK